MRLVTYRSGAGPRTLGVLVDHHEVVPLPGQIEDLLFGKEDPLAVLRPQLKALQKAENPLPLAGLRLLAPLVPTSLRDFMAFEDHAKAGAARRGEELAAVWYERPLYYKGNHQTIVGTEEEVVRPPFTQALDFELEVACVTGRLVADADEIQAADAILGFTVMCDWSARDVQAVEMAARLGPAKSKDFATSLGPALLTADEAGAHPPLKMEARLNGKRLVEANLADAYWTFPQMISFVSQSERVLPGAIFGSGTPFGGCLLDHGADRWLEPGDVVELEVEGIGVLRNRVVTDLSASRRHL